MSDINKRCSGKNTERCGARHHPTGGVDGVYRKKLNDRRRVNILVSTNVILVWVVMFLAVFSSLVTAGPTTKNYDGDNDHNGGDNGGGTKPKLLRFPGNIVVGPCGTSNDWRGTVIDRKDLEQNCWDTSLGKRLTGGYGTGVISAMPTTVEDNSSLGGVRLGWNWVGNWFENWTLFCYEATNDNKIRAWSTSLSPTTIPYNSILGLWQNLGDTIKYRPSC